MAEGIIAVSGVLTILASASGWVGVDAGNGPLGRFGGQLIWRKRRALIALPRGLATARMQGEMMTSVFKLCISVFVFSLLQTGCSRIAFERRETYRTVDEFLFYNEAEVNDLNVILKEGSCSRTTELKHLTPRRKVSDFIYVKTEFSATRAPDLLTDLHSCCTHIQESINAGRGPKGYLEASSRACQVNLAYLCDQRPTPSIWGGLENLRLDKGDLLLLRIEKFGDPLLHEPRLTECSREFSDKLLKEVSSTMESHFRRKGPRDDLASLDEEDLTVLSLGLQLIQEHFSHIESTKEFQQKIPSVIEENRKRIEAENAAAAEEFKRRQEKEWAEAKAREAQKRATPRWWGEFLAGWGNRVAKGALHWQQFPIGSPQEEAALSYLQQDERRLCDGIKEMRTLLSDTEIEQAIQNATRLSVYYNSGPPEIIMNGFSMMIRNYIKEPPEKCMIYK